MNTVDQNNNEEKKGTFSHAGTLPRVPLPELADTKKRFIEWCSPLLSGEELAETRQAIDLFAKEGGLGEKLQAELKDYDKSPGVHSWLDRFWQSRYLGRRDPIALNANFFFLFQHFEMTQAERAAAIIVASLNYKLVLDQELLPVAMNRKTPLDMDQLKYLFSATRIPGSPEDSLRSFYSKEQPGPSTARHILVLYRGNIVKFDVIGENGSPYTLANLEAGIDNVLHENLDRPPVSRCVGHLTTMPRAHWGEVREQLIAASHTNKADLDVIETALFAINLEDEEPLDNLTACNHLLHGDSANRWFDKALQMVVFKNGVAGINIEHCALDGTTILNFVDYILGVDPNAMDEYNGAVDQDAPRTRKLVFDLPPNLQKEISNAADAFAKLSTTTVTRTFDFSDFGSDHIKSLKMSPDAFAQCAMQLAHFRSKGFIGATYESIATRQNERGRTEAMRTVTPEVKDFVKDMLDSSKTDEEKIAAFRLAGDKHIARARDCQSGKAPEQHLWELSNIYHREPEKFTSDMLQRMFGGGGLSAREAEEALALFGSPGWIKMRSDSLSTSSAPSPSIIYFGFGSTGPGCIGIGYLVRNDQINCYLSTAQGEGDALDSYIANWETALRELGALLEKDPALQPKKEEA